jgi:hypothetical protein
VLLRLRNQSRIKPGAVFVASFFLLDFYKDWAAIAGNVWNQYSSRMVLVSHPESAIQGVNNKNIVRPFKRTVFFEVTIFFDSTF